MPQVSAGLLMYRRSAGALEYFLVHPGGPFFARRDAGVWSIPKGEFGDGEEPLDVALREFHEETGRTADACGATDFVALGSVRQPSGKLVHAWGFAGDWPDGLAVTSNTFELEWPRGTGRVRTWPEVDDGRFFADDEARRRIIPAQAAFLDRLADHVERA